MKFTQVLFALFFFSTTILSAQSYKTAVTCGKTGVPTHMYNAVVTSASYHQQQKVFYAAVAFKKNQSYTYSYSAYKIADNGTQWLKISALSDVDKLEYVSHNRGINGYFAYTKNKKDYVYNPVTNRSYEVIQPGMLQRNSPAVYEGNTIYQLGHLKTGGKANLDLGVIYYSDVNNTSSGKTILLASEINKEIQKMGINDKATWFGNLESLGLNYFFLTFKYKSSNKYSAAVIRIQSGKVTSVKVLLRNISSKGVGKFSLARGGFYADQSSPDKTIVYDRAGNVTATHSKSLLENIKSAKINEGNYWTGDLGQILYDKQTQQYNPNSMTFFANSKKCLVKVKTEQLRGGAVNHFLILEKQ
jgi:hypothetical protein